MERAQDSQTTSGNGDESGETSRQSQSHRRLDCFILFDRRRLNYSVPGRYYWTQTSENFIFALRSINAGNRAGDDRTASVDPEREAENVPDDQTGTAQDQELADGLRRRESDGDVGDDRRGRVDAEQEREKVVPDDQAARLEGQELAKGPSMIPDQESTAGSHGQRRDDHILTLDSTDTSSRQRPLLGSNSGTDNQSAATQGQESMHSVTRESAGGRSRQTEWPQLFERLRVADEKKKEAQE
ncbi:hypothetical protein ACJRO7_033780 [Eucalyptus globulus]|uniref:Uncharacterized protein n=1 Tax=Eucalyptus globulus TaxID=34317 RepID=A0ABD3J6K2_EUCGL